MHDMNKRYPCFSPIPALIVIIVAMFFIVKPSIYHDPLWLIISITNTLFVVATGLCAADPSPIYPLDFKKERR